VIQICDCEYRGKYEDEDYSSCYQCYLDRRDEFDSCIWCGKWHSPRYHTCYTCRTVHHREDAGQALKLAILMRDDFQCQRLGCESRDQPEIDHVFPCFEGGTADVWNLQVLCHACNKAKGRTWYYGSSHWDRRVALMHLYFTYYWDWLDDEERKRLADDADRPDYQGQFLGRSRYLALRGHPIGHWPDEQDSHALAARLGIDHETLEPLSELDGAA
jgi:5-methylcytosine-specific restriction endonuclease McrA